MWSYYELLTDLSVLDIGTLRRQVAERRRASEAVRRLDLGRRIVTDFHSADAASTAEPRSLSGDSPRTGLPSELLERVDGGPGRR